jgi:hypothetical protein
VSGGTVGLATRRITDAETGGTVDSNSRPMVPDLDVFPRPVRRLILAVLVLGPLVLAGLVLLGASSSPTVVLEATVVDAAPADAEVYPLSGFPEDSPTRDAVEDALRDGSGSVEATTEAVRSDDVPATEYYVRHDGRVVKVSVNSNP